MTRILFLALALICLSSCSSDSDRTSTQVTGTADVTTQTASNVDSVESNPDETNPD